MPRECSEDTLRKPVRTGLPSPRTASDFRTILRILSWQVQADTLGPSPDIDFVNRCRDWLPAAYQMLRTKRVGKGTFLPPSLKEARVVIESWRRHYNEVRPHSSLDYRPPAPAVRIPARPAALPQPAPPGAQPLVQRPFLN